jgi:hypothetical protein
MEEAQNAAYLTHRPKRAETAPSRGKAAIRYTFNVTRKKTPSSD